MGAGQQFAGGAGEAVLRHEVHARGVRTRVGEDEGRDIDDLTVHGELHAILPGRDLGAAEAAVPQDHVLEGLSPRGPQVPREAVEPRARGEHVAALGGELAVALLALRREGAHHPALVVLDG